MKKYLYMILLLPLFLGCKNEDLKPIIDEHRIFFNSVSGTHEIHYSFLYALGAEQVDLNIPISYSGSLFTENSTFHVSVVADSTTATENLYEVKEENIFAPHQLHDSLVVKLNYQSQLDNEVYRLSLQLVDGGDYRATMRDSLKMDIYFTNMVSKPIWWTSDVEAAYLGSYSEKKLRAFTEIYAGDYGLLSEDEKLHYAREFKYSLEDNPLYEEDGTLMTVPVIG